MLIGFQTHLKGKSLLYLFKNVMKPNFTQLASRQLQIKSVGFHSVSGEWDVSEKVMFFYDFQVFGGIRSTQPTGLKRFLKSSRFPRLM